MRKILFVLLYLMIMPALHSQELEWLAGFDGFLDNREYQNSVQHPQTIFGSRFRFEFGGSYDQVHRLRAGLNYMYEFGGEPDALKPSPTLYYNLNYKPFTFYLGAFPRRDILDYPLALLSDTLNYYRPNIEGLSLCYAGEWGYQNVFIDWTGRQTETDFERFMFGSSGRINYKFLFLTHHFLMGHFASPRIIPPGFHLRDNGGFDLQLGTDLSEFTFFDTLTFTAGALVSMDRLRGVYNEWETPAGFFSQLLVNYRGLGFQGTYYRGKGHEFLYGDSFYRAKEYGRMDFFWQPFNKRNIRGKIVFSIHFIEHKIDNSQQILVSIDIGGIKPVREDQRME